MSSFCSSLMGFGFFQFWSSRDCAVVNILEQVFVCTQISFLLVHLGAISWVSCRDCVAHFTKLLRCFTFPLLARGSRILTSSPLCHYLLSVLVDVLLLNTLNSSNLCFIRCQPCVRHWYKLWGPRWRAEAQISVVGNTWWVVISGQAW